MIKTVIFSFALMSSLLCIAQSDTDILFSVNDNPVNVSEFKYIYEKNNRDNASYTKESIEEYLELYTNFKLKVERAKELGLHEKESYKQELEGYRKQLADSYVIDREVIDQIVEELYMRKQLDVAVKHILVNVNRKSTEAQESAALKQVQMIQEKLREGSSFEEVAKEFSADKNSASLGGDIGYITAALPDGYVELENAAYSLPLDQISDPVRTDLGWHIVKVTDRRPARGRMEVQHILVRKKKAGKIIENAQDKAEQIYNRLQEDPTIFDDLARTLSDDKQTADKGGNLGFFGISEFEKSFEDAAFALANNGDISQPVESSIGWHIIRRRSKKSPETKDQLKAIVKSKMNVGERFELQKEKVVQEILQEAGFDESEQAMNTFVDSLNHTIFEYNWRPVEYPAQQLLSIGEQSFDLNDFAEYCRISTKTRLRPKDKNIDKLINELYTNYVQDKAIGYVESHLEEKYVDFKNLLREYQEGILLFEITKNEVWDKATDDTLGLKNYFNSHQGKYIWEPRADVTQYTIRSIDPNLISSITTDAVRMTPEELTAKYNEEKELILYDRQKLERSNELLRGLSLTEGTYSTPSFNKGLQVTTFNKIEKTYPAQKKTLKESRGYVISDYQDELEKKWIAELRARYKVSVNKKTLKKLIK